MAQKPEIQYVGRFYVHGSEARALEAELQKKEKKTAASQPKYIRKRQIQVDAVAIAGILMAAVLLVCMVAATVSMQTAWLELKETQRYVYDLEAVNLTLRERFSREHDMGELYNDAREMGMVPEHKVEIRPMNPVVPQTVEESWLDEIVWSVRHMFAA